MKTQHLGSIVCGFLLGACTPSLTSKLSSDEPVQLSSLQLSAATLVADGVARANIHLWVRDHRGAPVPNVRATFYLEDHKQPQSVWLVQPGPTDSNGKTTGILLSETIGPVSIGCRLYDLGRDASALTVLRAGLDCVAPN